MQAVTHVLPGGGNPRLIANGCNHLAALCRMVHNKGEKIA